jgi:hypothetical protein
VEWGAAHGLEQLMCAIGAPLLPYIKDGGRRRQPLVRHPLGPASSFPSFIYGGGRPNSTHQLFQAVCGAPSIVYTFGQIFGDLRRSPAEITSPSPSPRRRADGTHLLPQRLAGSRRRGTSPSCTCVELGGAVRSVLDRWISKKV